MLSRTVRAVPRAAPLRSVRAVAPFAARSVTTDAASSSLSNKVPEVRVNWPLTALDIDLARIEQKLKRFRSVFNSSVDGQCVDVRPRR